MDSIMDCTLFLNPHHRKRFFFLTAYLTENKLGNYGNHTGCSICCLRSVHTSLRTHLLTTDPILDTQHFLLPHFPHHRTQTVYVQCPYVSSFSARTSLRTHPTALATTPDASLAPLSAYFPEHELLIATTVSAATLFVLSAYFTQTTPNNHCNHDHHCRVTIGQKLYSPPMFFLTNSE